MNRKISLATVFIALLSGLAVPAIEAAAPQVLHARATVRISSSSKRFDLLAMDVARHRLLAAHSQAGMLSVVDVRTRKLEREVPVGESSGVAVDDRDNKYFVGTTEGVAVVDRNTLKRTGFVDTHGPADAMAYDPANDRLYVGHDDGSELWVIDAHNDKLISHIEIPGTPELMGIDLHTNRLYLNIKNLDRVVAIDLESDKVVANWPTAPTKSPHGLALDLKGQRLFIAGHSPDVAVISLPDGKPLPAISIGEGRVDQIAFDPATGRLYCPSSGRLVVVDTRSEGKTVGSVAIPQGTHSVTVDPDTHWVWIAYADDKGSFVQAFVP